MLLKSSTWFLTVFNINFVQTVFIISVCNNQLLHWIENELIWVLSHIPGFASVLPNLVSKLHKMRDKYMVNAPPVTSNIKVFFCVISVYTSCIVG